MATLRDISKVVKTSEATVSLVLNGHYHRVSEKTRLRIEAAAAKLGYRPNRMAQNLARGKTMNVMVLLNDLRNPFYAGLAAQVSQLLEEQGYHIIPSETKGDVKREAELLNLATQQVSDGVLCLEALPNQEPEIYADIAARMPFVIRHQIYPKFSLDLPPGLTRLGVDYGRGCEALFEHLKERGVRRLGMLLDKEHDPSRSPATVAAVGCFFRDLLSRSSTWLEHKAIQCVSDEAPLDEWFAQTKLLLAQNPDTDGLYVHHLRAVPAVYAAIEEQGMIPGKDIAVVSVDDHESAKWMRPGVTVIAESLEETARVVVMQLLGRLSGAGKPVELKHRTSVIVRESTMNYTPRR